MFPTRSLSRARTRVVLAVALAATASGCASRGDASAEAAEAAVPTERPVDSTGIATPTTVAAAPVTGRTPNELGRIPVFEYHLIGDRNATYERTRAGLRHDLEVMYARGYRPVNMVDVLDRKLDLPAGTSPVVLVFDDASPSQFRYVERDGRLEIDTTTAVGIIESFRRTHPDWGTKAVFCMLSGAEAGRSFFGDKGIEGQKSDWRFTKVRWLHEQGYELCNHTLWHANLARYSDEVVQEQIARGQMAIDSAVPGYRVRTFALPQGAWPKNRALAHQGSWTDPKTKRVVRYTNDAILEVAGGPTESPYDPAFDPRSVTRVQVIGDSAVSRTLQALEKSGKAYVSDGNARAVARRPETASPAAKKAGHASASPTAPTKAAPATAAGH